MSSTSTRAIRPLSSQVKEKTTCGRGKRGSREKQKEAAKEKSSIIRRKKT